MVWAWEVSRRAGVQALPSSAVGPRASGLTSVPRFLVEDGELYPMCEVALRAPQRGLIDCSCTSESVFHSVGWSAPSVSLRAHRKARPWGALGLDQRPGLSQAVGGSLPSPSLLPVLFPASPPVTVLGTPGAPLANLYCTPSPGPGFGQKTLVLTCCERTHYKVLSEKSWLQARVRLSASVGSGWQ